MKNKRKPKIFHGLVNYGSQAGYLAKGLRDLGFYAYSYTSIDVYDRMSDFQFKRKPNFLSKLYYYKIVYPFIKIRCFFKFDIFHFYFGKTLFSNNIDLYFYKLFGKKVVMEYLGNEIRPHSFIVKRFNLSDEHPFQINSENHDKEVQKRVIKENKYCDLKLICLPLYQSYADMYGAKISGLLDLAIPIPERIEYPEIGEKLIIMHAPTSRKFKGTEYFINAVEKMKENNLNVELIILENISHEELLKRIGECHIFCDQISEGWYGTVALEAMALGKPTLAFIDWEIIEKSGLKYSTPVINVDCDSVYDKLLELYERQNELESIGEISRQFVIKKHSIDIVAKKLVKFYSDII